jgi:hypothetical protein
MSSKEMWLEEYDRLEQELGHEPPTELVDQAVINRLTAMIDAEEV